MGRGGFNGVLDGPILDALPAETAPNTRREPQRRSLGPTALVARGVLGAAREVARGRQAEEADEAAKAGGTELELDAGRSTPAARVAAEMDTVPEDGGEGIPAAGIDGRRGAVRTRDRVHTREPVGEGEANEVAVQDRVVAAVAP